MATPSSSPGHIRKRPYQPSITSFFGARDTDSTTTPQLQRSSTSPLSPALPAETQASLLSVGMRVRKSVPEGYKTHKTLATQEYPFPSSAPPKSSAPIRSAYSGGRTRELMPFCGLHKTGGWAAQEVPASSAPPVMGDDYDDDDDEEMVPDLMESQTTLPSTQGSFMSTSPVRSASSKKRTYDEEAEEEMDAYFGEVEAEDVMDEQMRVGDRPMARMKGSGPRGTVRVAGVDDFEEAGFLMPGDGMDVDGR